jgi:hypothetical protein
MDVLKKFYPHVLFILGFVLISCVYFYPVLQGKKIFQSDIVQYTGMAKEQNDFRAAEKTEPYWTNAAFGGMPTYQLGANYPHEYISQLDHALRFLPRPADYLLLYFIGFYVLLLVLKIEPLQAFFGALAFGFSTYLIVILGVGHNAKAHAIAYMPLVVAGVLLVFKRRYVLGGILTMIAAALEINANHFQMTYYLLILLLIVSGFFIYNFIKEKQFKSLLTTFGVFAITGILAIGVNATNLMATSEYAKYSTRDKSELTFNADGTKNKTENAMSNEYITEYSYGIAESLNLFAPRLFGGSNSENIGTDGAMYEFILSQNVPESQAKDFVSAMPTYWGDQPIVAAPAYIGAVVFFLCIVSLFVVKRRIKYAFLTAALVSLLLSWGKNFPVLTDFCIEYLPMYNKFRAVSSIQVLLELCAPVLAILGLQAFIKSEKELQWKALWQSTAIGVGVLVVLFFLRSSFNFSGPSDRYFMESYGPQFVDALKSDRKSLYAADLLRSGFFITVVAVLLWMFNKERLAKNTTIILVGLLMVSDLFFIDKNYVDSSDFVRASEVDVPFQPTEADLMIQRDTAHFRVFEVDGNLSSARASYFHKSIGGYHAAKPRRMQQLFDYQIAKNNMNVLDMLNVRYVLQADTTGNVIPRLNQYANGNAWFVQEVKWAQTADQEMKDLDSLDTRNTAIVNQKEFGTMLKKNSFPLDSLASITLKQYKPNYLKYTANNSNEGLAVFSEMYYADGWNAFIDGNKVPHFRADYALRALVIPAGKHQIEFKFEPQVVKTGSTIAMASSLGMVLLILGGLYFERRKSWFSHKKD